MNSHPSPDRGCREFHGNNNNNNNNNEYIYIAQNKQSSDAPSLCRRNKLPNVAADSDETRRFIGSESQMTAQETAKSLASITVRVRRTTSFRVSADLKCRLLATDETSTQSSARYGDACLWRHL